jgi:hypothetical protein
MQKFILVPIWHRLQRRRVLRIVIAREHTPLLGRDMRRGASWTRRRLRGRAYRVGTRTIPWCVVADEHMSRPCRRNLGCLWYLCSWCRGRVGLRAVRAFVALLVATDIVSFLVRLWYGMYSAIAEQNCGGYWSKATFFSAVGDSTRCAEIFSRSAISYGIFCCCNAVLLGLFIRALFLRRLARARVQPSAVK